MNDTRFLYLFNSYFNSTANPSEERELLELASTGEYDTLTRQLIAKTYELEVPASGQNGESIERIFANIVKRKEAAAPKLKVIGIVPQWGRVAAAAMILFCLGITGYYISRNNTSTKLRPTEINMAKNDIAAPTSSKATLTLSNGKTVSLDSVASGTLAQQGNVNVTKTVEGKIIYSGTTNETAFNTLSNPRGSNVVDMILTDGSHVWLNAGSSITYPLTFSGDTRKVDITGEAYFEVAHNAAMPFVAEKGDMRVQVLGTHFNVNTYEDEDLIRVSLLEGSVKVSAAEKSNVIIRPGQQARVDADKNITVSVPDLQEVMAWKNGKFQFGEGADIRSVMRQISRWYDVDVEYKGTVTGHIGGTISRTVNAGDVFRMLEMTGGIKFKIEGKKVTVMN